MDFSEVEVFEVSAAAARAMGEFPPSGKDLQTIRIVVAPEPSIFGLARMFEAHAVENMPTLAVVRSMDEAFEILRVGSPNFVPLDPGHTPTARVPPPKPA